MTAIRRFGPFRQARVEASALLAVYRNGRLVRSGRGLAVWFATHGATSLVEIPVDDHDNVISVSATSRDFQAVSVQGLATWRAADPLRLAAREATVSVIGVVQDRKFAFPMSRAFGQHSLEAHLCDKVADVVGVDKA